MFEVLVYLYENYYRPDACPEPAALMKKLSAVGFEDDEISQALGWLTDLQQANHDFAGEDLPILHATGTRVYVAIEQDILGIEGIGFIQFLESSGLINAAQREIIVNQAMLSDELPISLEKLKVIILMVLWGQGKEPDLLMFDALGLDEEEENTVRHLHS